MSSVKLLIVSAPGGARADFTAGWLGTLPEFVNSYWNIDPTTGVSLGNMGRLRQIDYDKQLPTQVLNSCQLELSNQSSLTWAVACHGYQIDGKMYEPYINNGSIKFLSIDISKADKSKINWEFFAKTYLSTRRGLDWVQRDKSYIIDDHISADSICDQQRIDKIINLLEHTKVPNVLKDLSLPTDVPAVILDYVQLFDENGSRYLCDKLDLVVPERHHHLWKSMLLFADCPEEIKLWGVTWKKSDWFF
jgi:hypothetical protein